MTDAGEPFAKIWLAIGLVLVALVLATVVITVVMFALRRRTLRLEAAFGGHPAGTALRARARRPRVALLHAPPPTGPPVDLPPPVDLLAPADLFPPLDLSPPAASAPSPPPSVALAPLVPPPSAAATAAVPAGGAPSGTGGRRRRESVPPIRVAEPEDEARLAEIDAQTAAHGVSHSGLGALPSPGLRDEPARASVVLVAGRPALGYVRVDELDRLAHVDRLCVLPAATRRGIGKALLKAAMDWAAEHDYRAMTLSTFADVDWNPAVFGAVGFAFISDLTPGLSELRDWERALGLDSMGRRVVMRRNL